jgi:transposase
LEEKARRGEIELIYFDQSGFSLTASVVYAWQEIGKRLEVSCAKSKLQNVLGFMWKGCEKFRSFIFEGGVRSSEVIYCIDEIVSKIKKKTVLVLDNAPIHRSEEFEGKIEEWESKGLQLYYLPPYSSELNKIEILWKRIKYEWLPLEAYQSYQKLKEEVDKVLSQVGSKYKITFA